MIKGYFKINILNKLRTCFLLALVCSNPVYSSYHSIHSHIEDSKHIVAHLSEVDVEHLPHSPSHHPHHHHHGDKTDSDDHQHFYDNDIDWHLLRVQNLRSQTFEEQSFNTSLSTISIVLNQISSTVDETFSFIDENYSHFLIIRGPPFLV